MWAALQHPRHVQFYEELQRDRYERGEDWQPMIRAVQYLQAQPYASQLYAFTSLADFHITTAPSYEDFQGHRTVGVTWMFRDRAFRLSLGKSWSGRRQNERTCEERDFPSNVDSLIQGLLLQDDRHGA